MGEYIARIHRSRPWRIPTTKSGPRRARRLVQAAKASGAWTGRILVALSYRVGATAAAGMLVIPAMPIPGLDAFVDIGAPLALIWYWWTFFRNARRRPPEKPAP